MVNENRERKKQNQRFVRDGNGKFVSPPKNPDCEPATKGFVKCLMRKGMNHSHGWVAGEFGIISLGCIIGWGATLVLSLLGFASSAPGIPPIVAAAYWAPFALVFSLILTIVYIDISLSEGTMSKTANGGEIPKEFKKYEPPTCEKEECE